MSYRPGNYHYNEQWMLAAFLYGNTDWEVLWAPIYMESIYEPQTFFQEKHAVPGRPWSPEHPEDPPSSSDAARPRTRGNRAEQTKWNGFGGSWMDSCGIYLRKTK
jgi:hypothetical protein